MLSLLHCHSQVDLEKVLGLGAFSLEKLLEKLVEVLLLTGSCMVDPLIHYEDPLIHKR